MIKPNGSRAGRPCNLFYRDAPELARMTSRECLVRAESANNDSRTVTALMSTETPVTVYDWASGRIIEEILITAGMEPTEDMPLLESHGRWTTEYVLGSVRNARTSAEGVLGDLIFARNVQAAEDAWQRVSQKHVRRVSVGYNPIEYTDLAPNTEKTLNGKTYKAGARGLRITQRWQLRETSLVVFGADQFAKIRSELGLSSPLNPNQGSERMLTENQRAYLFRMGLRRDANAEQILAFYQALTDEQRAACDAYAGETQTRSEVPGGGGAPAEGGGTETPATTPVPGQEGNRAEPTPGEIAAQAVRAERERVTAIRQAAGDDIPGEIVQRALDEGWTLARAEGEFLRTYRERRAQPVGGNAPGILSQQDATREALAYGVLQRCNMIDQVIANPSNNQAQRQQHERHAEAGRRYAWMSMFDICRAAVEMTGARDPMTGGQPTDREAYIRAAVSSGSLSYIFGTSVNAALMQGYTEAPDTSDWVREADVVDFKSQEEIDVTASSGLERLGAGNTATHATLSDLRETWKIARFAKQFCADEQDFINDNLGVLTEMPMEMGRAARRLKPDLVYAILLANPSLVADGAALFVAGHNNLDANALSAANLKTGVTKMRKQTKGGVNLNLSPAYLICATELEWTAAELLQSAAIVIAGTAGAVTERGSKNVLADLNIKIRSEGRISNGVTDPMTGTAYAGSATAWFLATSPNQGPTIKVGYLVGTGRAPQIRSYVLDRGRWGIGWDIKHDIGAAPIDYRGLYKGNA